ncbi:hypothetical protein Ccrd_018441, partial [Cynara cardunculus var. scolymus]
MMLEEKQRLFWLDLKQQIKELLWFLKLFKKMEELRYMPSCWWKYLDVYIDLQYLYTETL